MVIDYDTIRRHDNNGDAAWLLGEVEAMKKYIQKKSEIFIEVKFDDEINLKLQSEEDIDKFIKDFIATRL